MIIEQYYKQKIKEAYLKQVHKLAICDIELVDVYDLNTKIDCFEKGKVKHELKVAEMYEELVKLKTQVNQSEYKKETLESKGSRVDECTGKSKSRLKLDLKKKMNDALWFAETFGLFPIARET